MHYARKWRGKDVGPAHPIDRVGMTPDRQEYTGEITQCLCGNTFRQRAIGAPKRYCSTTCRARYTAQAKRAEPDFVPFHKRDGAPPCSIEGCEESRFSFGYCVMHYNRFKTQGDPGEAAPRRARNGEGEWHPNTDGYIIRN